MDKKAQKNLKDKVILVTGGTGSIGSAIIREIIKYKPKQIRIFSRDETKQFFLQHELERMSLKNRVRFLIGDIRDKERLDKAFGGVDIVFHTAALKHVPFCEYNPFEAIKTNIYGTQNVIDLAIKNSVKKVIAISTDKAVYPTSIMGTTKLLMEKMILSTRWYLYNSQTKFSVVRFGNVLNSRGSVLPLWSSQLKSGQPLTITDPKMTRYFMTIKEAVKLIIQAAAIMLGQEIFILKMPKISIGDLATEFIKNKKIKKEIKIKITGQRDGEKLHEELFTEAEREFLIELKDMYILIPYRDMYKKRSKNNYNRR